MGREDESMLLLSGGQRIKKFVSLGFAILFCGFLSASAQTRKIYWGDPVPTGWNGSWPAKFLTVPERTKFERSASSTEVLEFIDGLPSRPSRSTGFTGRSSTAGTPSWFTTAI